MEVLGGEERTNYPLTLSVDDLGEGFLLTAQVQKGIGAGRVCGFMSRALGHLVEMLETAPSTPARRLEVMPEAERQQVLEEWNATAAEYPRERCVHELFEEQVERTPGAVAVVFEDRKLAYSELNVRANRLAHHLRALGVGPESRVAICVERGLEMVVGVLGILKAGGAYVPLDPAYPRERLAFMLADSAPVALLTDSGSRGVLAGCTDSLAVIDLEMDADRWAEQPGSNPDRNGIGLTSEDLAYVIYTSGSTGAPKGVAIEHGNAVNFIWWAQTAFAGEALERMLFSTSLNFDLATYELYVPLATGGMVRIVENALELLSEGTDVTLINTVPSALDRLVDAGCVPTTVRNVNVAGEPLKGAL